MYMLSDKLQLSLESIARASDVRKIRKGQSHAGGNNLRPALNLMMRFSPSGFCETLESFKLSILSGLIDRL